MRRVGGASLAIMAAGALWAAGAAPMAGPVARGEAERTSSALTVDDFGAKGDAHTDDGAAFAAYAGYLRQQYAAGRPPRAWRLGAGKIYVVSAPIDLTNFLHYAFDGAGSTIAVNAGGVYAALDMLGTEDIRLQNLRITCGSQASPCVNGIQFGRATDGTTKAENNFDNIELDGFFTQAAVYNHGSELFLASALIARNRYAGPSWSYALIEDGTNHWPLTSRFVTTSVAADSYASFTGQNFVRPVLYNKGNGPAVWMSGLGGSHSYVGGYVQVQGDGAYPAAVLSFTDRSGFAHEATGLVWDVHAELHPSAMFLVSGAIAPSIDGLAVRDAMVQSDTLFALDHGVASLRLLSADIATPRFLRATARYFDRPAGYAMTGDIAVLSAYATAWNAPGGFSGRLASDHLSGFRFGRGVVTAQTLDGVTVLANPPGAYAAPQGSAPHADAANR